MFCDAESTNPTARTRKGLFNLYVDKSFDDCLSVSLYRYNDPNGEENFCVKIDESKLSDMINNNILSWDMEEDVEHVFNLAYNPIDNVEFPGMWPTSGILANNLAAKDVANLVGNIANKEGSVSDVFKQWISTLLYTTPVLAKYISKLDVSTSGKGFDSTFCNNLNGIFTDDLNYILDSIKSPNPVELTLVEVNKIMADMVANPPSDGDVITAYQSFMSPGGSEDLTGLTKFTFNDIDLQFIIYIRIVIRENLSANSSSSTTAIDFALVSGILVNYTAPVYNTNGDQTAQGVYTLNIPVNLHFKKN
jgi:hypothetical protein